MTLNGIMRVISPNLVNLRSNTSARIELIDQKLAL